MTPQEMAALEANFGTPDFGSSKSNDNRIHIRRYNVVVRTKNNKIVETYEMVSLKTAREIRKEAHEENLIADIIEDWTMTYSDKEIDPKPIVSNLVEINPKNNASQPTLTDHKNKIRSARNLAKAMDNIARSTKHEKSGYHIFRIVNKSLKIDIQDTQAKITEFLTGRNDLDTFTIIYCGYCETWGKDII